MAGKISEVVCVCGTTAPADQKFCGECGGCLQTVPISPSSPPPASESGSGFRLSSRTMQGKLFLIASVFVIGLIGVIVILGKPKRGLSSDASKMLTLEAESRGTPEEQALRRARARAEIARLESEERQEIARLRDERAETERRKKLELVEKENAAAVALGDLRGKHDDIQGITWYRSYLVPDSSDQNIFSLYFGALDSGLGPLRLKIAYTADRWIFIQSFIIRADAERFDITAKYDDVSSDHSPEKAWEWYDAPVPEEQFAMLDRIANSRKAILRYKGRQYHKDREVTLEEKRAMKSVLKAYRALETLPLERQKAFLTEWKAQALRDNSQR